MRRSAFTLLELLLVLAIVIVISGIGITSYRRQYARAQFKSGVVQIQVDLSLARLLAMRTGKAYVFRYVPGSGVYEIAPLRTLQETLYRINGEAVKEDDSSALGGSLTGVGATNSGATDLFGSTLGGASGLYGEPVYTDDLFSPENIAADMAEISRQSARASRAGSTSVDLSGGLGGGLGFAPDANFGSEFGDSSVVFGASGSINSPTSSYGTDYATDFSGYGAEFSTGTDLYTGADPSTLATLQTLDGTEKLLQDEHALATRINLDGLVIRKQIPGEVVFTYSRLSSSTPSVLRTRRPGGVKDNSKDDVYGSSDGEDMGSRLGGSLRSIPTKREGDAAGLGGGLGAPAELEQNSVFGALTEEDARPVGLWSEPLLFFPNGKTSNAIIGFASLGEASFYSEIALRGLTGVAKISAISSAPIELDPSRSALTEEQLFRLRNPNYASSDSFSARTALGGALGSVSTPDSFDPSQFADPFAETSPGIATSGLGELGATPTLGYGQASEGYGSRERRSNYRFDETSASGSGAASANPPTNPSPNAFLESSTAALGTSNQNAPGMGSAFDALGGSGSQAGAPTSADRGGTNSRERSGANGESESQDGDKSKTGGGL